MQGTPIERLRATGGAKRSLSRKKFDLSAGTEDERSLVASFEADVPFEVRAGTAARLSFVTGQEFTTDGSADNTETFNLDHNVVETPNTVNVVLYEGGNRVAPDSVDYDADSFDYTDDGTNNTLHVFYVARDPGLVTIEKVAPKTTASLTETLEEDTTSALADRDQNREPVTFEQAHAYEGVIPTDWTLNVYVDAPFAVLWDDSPLATSNGDGATNAVLDLPIYQYEQTVDGLEDAVKRHALGIAG